MQAAFWPATSRKLAARPGIIKGRQLCRGAPWAIKVEDMVAYREQKPSRRSLTSDPTQQSFMFQ
jgi:hypothetical protein